MFGATKESKLCEAAERGSPTQQCDLGTRYETGNGVRKDFAEAAKWYRRAAERGLPSAQYHLARLFALGLGLEPDFAQSLRWTRLAAKGGFPWAQVSLGAMYDEGKGVPQNNHQAVRWYRRAAHQGDRDGMYCLGNMYASGHGVENNDRQAARWFQRAAAKGHKLALNNLMAMRERGRVPAVLAAITRDDLLLEDLDLIMSFEIQDRPFTESLCFALSSVRTDSLETEQMMGEAPSVLSGDVDELISHAIFILAPSFFRLALEGLGRSVDAVPAVVRRPVPKDAHLFFVFVDTLVRSMYSRAVFEGWDGAGVEIEPLVFRGTYGAWPEHDTRNLYEGIVGAIDDILANCPEEFRSWKDDLNGRMVGLLELQCDPAQQSSLVTQLSDVFEELISLTSRSS